MTRRDRMGRVMVGTFLSPALYKATATPWQGAPESECAPQKVTGWEKGSGRDGIVARYKK